MNHCSGAQHLFIRGKSLILFGKNNGSDYRRIILDAFSLDNQLHGIVFTIHEIERTFHGCQQFVQCRFETCFS